jgi:uncharacterized membrane protein YtjA (UPF0391 family)
MIRYSLIFFGIACGAAILGFGGIAVAALRPLEEFFSSYV